MLRPAELLDLRLRSQAAVQDPMPRLHRRFRTAVFPNTSHHCPAARSTRQAVDAIDQRDALGEEGSIGSIVTRSRIVTSFFVFTVFRRRAAAGSAKAFMPKGARFPIVTRTTRS
jgi:hypothetical protein